MPKKVLSIPGSMRHELFFVDKIEIVITNHEEGTVRFYKDLLEANQIENLSFSKEEVLDCFKVWKETEPIIRKYFGKRDRKRAKDPMIDSLALFLQALFWGNGRTVKRLIEWKDEIELFEITPVNLNERLSFIFQSPDHYHSFIQLQQLFTELEKQLHAYWRKLQNHE